MKEGSYILYFTIYERRLYHILQYMKEGYIYYILQYMREGSYILYFTIYERGFIYIIFYNKWETVDI